MPSSESSTTVSRSISLTDTTVLKLLTETPPLGSAQTDGLAVNNPGNKRGRFNVKPLVLNQPFNRALSGTNNHMVDLADLSQLDITQSPFVQPVDLDGLITPAGGIDLGVIGTAGVFPTVIDSVLDGDVIDGDVVDFTLLSSPVTDSIRGEALLLALIGPKFAVVTSGGVVEDSSLKETEV